MPIRIGTANLKRKFIGASEVLLVYVGAALIYKAITKYVSDYSARVLADGGTVEGLTNVTTLAQNLRNNDLFERLTLFFVPSGVKASKAYVLIPEDGTGALTVVRNTTATYFNSSMILVLAAANVARYTYLTVGGNPFLLDEAQRTNVIIQSNGFQTSTWVKAGSTAVIPIVTANSVLSPDNTINATLVEITSVADGEFSTLIQSITSITDNTTLSVFLRAFDASQVGKKVSLVGNGSSGVTGVSVTLSLSWQRFTFNRTSQISQILIGKGRSSYPSGCVSQAEMATKFYIYESQLEVGNTATSTIKTTTAAVTRNADVITRTPPAETIIITNTFSDDTTQVLTTIPANYTVPEGLIKQVLMDRGLQIVRDYSTRVLSDGGTSESLGSVSIAAQSLKDSGLFNNLSLGLFPSGLKTNKLYSLLPEDGNGDLTATRNTTATRINSAGLIENVAANVPRLNYTLNTGGEGFILAEGQRTNIAVFSNDFTNSQWDKLSFNGTSTVQANNVISPEGSLNAHTITPPQVVPPTERNNRMLRQISSATNLDFTFSIFVKSAVAGVSFKLIHMEFNSDTVVKETSFTTTNNWVRYSITSNTASLAGLRANISFGNTIQIYGGQIEIGLTLTSYIPTTTAAVTRNADNISKTGVSSLIGQTEGVIFIDCDYERTGSGVGARKLVSLNDGTSNNLIDIFIPNGLNSMFARVRAGAGGFGSIFTSAVPTGRIKLAYAYKANDYALFINGSLIQSVTTGGAFAFSVAPSVIQVGDGEAAGDEFGGRIHQTALFKTRLTDAQLITLTTL
jgi:hypothetical protein